MTNQERPWIVSSACRSAVTIKHVTIHSTIMEVSSFSSHLVKGEEKIEMVFFLLQRASNSQEFMVRAIFRFYVLPKV